MGADAKLMKELNKRQLRRVLRQCGEATKPELADRTGLSVVTINSLLEDFLKTGEAVQSGMAPSGGGRPSTRYQYRPDYRYAVLLYGHQSEGRNLMHLAVVNLTGECVWRKEEYFDEIRVESFESVLDDVIGRFPETGLLAFGLPGEVVNDVVTIHDYEALIGPDFMAHYKERYHLPVIFENDINAMTYGACRDDEMERATVAGIYLPRIYPPGAGLDTGKDLLWDLALCRRACGPAGTGFVGQSRLWECRGGSGESKAADSSLRLYDGTGNVNILWRFFYRGAAGTVEDLQ